MNIKKVALVLAGCGVYDGSEIHEAVITLLNLQKNNAQVSFFAPDVMQMHTINHAEGKEETCNRNVLVESARIARGNIAPLSQFDATEFDALVFPGGFGAAKNLSDFAVKGAEMSVNKDVENAISAMQKLGKKIGFICIAPVIAAKTIANKVKITIGNDPQVAQAINTMGAEHVNCTADSFVYDEKFNVYSTPAYMLAENTAQLDAGIGSMIAEMLK